MDPFNDRILQVESFPGAPVVITSLHDHPQCLRGLWQVHHPSDIINSYILLAVRSPLFVYHS
jgi:hypothetical protein